MKAELRLDRNMRFIGTTPKGHQTIYDTVPQVGGEDTAASPMHIFLQSLAACTGMDVVSILRKKRKTIDEFWVDVEGERIDEHPKIFNKVYLTYNLKSPDAELEDLKRCIELSQNKYCGASAMFKSAGCQVNYSMNLIKS